MKRRTLLGWAALIVVPTALAVAQTTPGQQARFARRVGSLLELPMPGVDQAPHSAKSVTDNTLLEAPDSKAYSFSTADYPGADYTVAFDANTSTTVGFFSYDGGVTVHAFTLTGSKYKTITPPGAVQTFLEGINTSDQMVGLFVDGSSKVHGFLDDSGTFTTIDYPGALSSVVGDINDAGAIVGYYTDSSGTFGFQLTSGVFTKISVPGAVKTLAWGINLNGDIVGSWTDSV
jgi:hypothetical protein